MAVSMTSFLHTIGHSLGRFAVLTAVLAGLIGTVHAVVDEDIDKGMWKARYGVTSAQIDSPTWMASDTDGDMRSNVDELDSGTNPFSASSAFRITATSTTATEFSMTFTTVAGKNYLAQAHNGSAWVTISPTVQVTGDGTDKTLLAPKSAGQFFRVMDQDLDTDNDTVSNWAELQVGLNPSNAVSSGKVDQDGLPISDNTYANQQLGKQGVMTIVAAEPSAQQPPSAIAPAPATGKFTIVRGGFSQFLPAATVNLTISGTAQSGVDYVPLSTSESLGAGVASKEVVVTPKFNSSQVNRVSVVATLQSSVDYTIGGQGWAAVIINPTDAPTGTGLLGRYWKSANPVYGHAANFGQNGYYNFTRNASDPNVGVLDVAYVYGDLTALTVGDQIKISFTYGFFTGSVYDHQIYTVTEKPTITAPTPSVPAHFKVSVAGAGLPDTSSQQIIGECTFSIQSRVHPPVLQRVDSAINFEWGTGKPFVEYIYPDNSPDNYCCVWEGYLAPSVAGNYTFRLDADDKARVLLDRNDQQGLVQILEHGWDSPATVGTFKESAQINLNVPANAAGRYRIRVEHIETTGNARCFLQWKLGSGAYSGIPLANMYTHTEAATCSFTRINATSGTATITLNGHGLVNGNTVPVVFTTYNPLLAYSGTFTVANATANTFDVAITGTSVPGGFGPGNHCIVEGRTASATNGATNRCYRGSTFSGPLSRAGSGPNDSLPNGDWKTGTPSNSPLVSPYFIPSDFFSARWTGQIQPEFTEEYTISVVADDAVKLWINGQLQTLKNSVDGLPSPDWVNAPERYVRIPLVGGERYDIKLEYREEILGARCLLSWVSPRQPKQIIPTARLYPSDGPQSAPTGPNPNSVFEMVVDGDSCYPISATNGGTVAVSNLPSWLTLSGPNGGFYYLCGQPPASAVGDYQVLITTTNANGTSTSVLNIHVNEKPSPVSREYWTGVSGSGVSAIPVGTAPTGTTALSSLQTPYNFGDNYGTRIRGYITAPRTGNYYFWLAASDAAELWISNDNDPINKIRRASVTAGSTVQQDWVTAKKSPWLALEAGRKYYFEVLHKAGTGSGDNLTVGWLQPDESGDPEVVPFSVMSPYIDLPGLADFSALGNTGTFYLTTMLAQNGANTEGAGTSVLRLSPDEQTAYMKYTYQSLTGPIISQHIHLDPSGDIVYDIDTPATPGDGLQPDGSYKWTITSVGSHSAADIKEAIKQGKAYINLHTASYPNGEIRGNYFRIEGSRTFNPPPAPPSWTSDHNTNIGAVRFLTQATFGPNIADITALKGMTSFEAWIDNQFLQPATTQSAEVAANESSDVNNEFDERLMYNAWWRNAITGTDQLRQRIAFALSEIFVISAAGPLDNRADTLSYYYDKLAVNAFGNFRDILEEVTLTPGMGRYLDMLRNDKPDPNVGRIPNENYAREIMQLFSIGLYRLWPDGTLMLSASGGPIETYTQREIVGYAHTFTGWDYGYDGGPRANFYYNVTAQEAQQQWKRQMREVPARHFTGSKRILNNEVLPGLSIAGGQPLDPYATHAASQYNDPLYIDLPQKELDATHDQLFNHPNVGPFICRQLIQRLVTSHPSRGYLYRVVQKFEDNGSGVRGDMKAVIKAILLDYEARSSTAAEQPTFGKQREPLLRVSATARAFRREAASGTYTQTAGSHAIKITMTNDLVAGDKVYLNFTSGSSAPTSEQYTVLGTPAPTATAFWVNAKGWIGINESNATTNQGLDATYSQASSTAPMAITVLSGHWVPSGARVYLDFGPAATGAVVSDQLSQVVTTSTSVDNVAGTTFQIPQPISTARTGRLRIPRFGCTYSVWDSGLAYPNDKRITIDTTVSENYYGFNTNHDLQPNDTVYLNIPNFPGASQPVPDGEFLVESVVDANTFTVLTTGVPNARENWGYVFPHKPLPTARSGNVTARPSTFFMNNTDDHFDQSPLNSPTVFNFFLPDYKLPGPLASQGLTTPEFQITTETTVLRAANFYYYGIFNPANTNGTSSSFKGWAPGEFQRYQEAHALVLDFSPWMGSATNTGLGAGPNTSKAWTNNANLAALIDQLSVLLTAGQLSTAAKTHIQNFVETLPHNNISATEVQRRDRLRSVIHLILTSPDYIIQR